MFRRLVVFAIVAILGMVVVGLFEAGSLMFASPGEEDSCNWVLGEPSVVGETNTEYSWSLGQPTIVLVISGPTVPTVTTQAATNIEDTTATGNGNITAVNNDTCDLRGFVWDLASQGAPGNVAPGASGYANDVAESNGFGTGAFTGSLTGLSTGDTIYARAYAHNEHGYAYGDEISFLTKPAAPTNVSATDGVHTDKVVITWTKSTGATDYHVWRDAVDLGAAGDVATVDDAGATAGTITSAGTVTASDGTSAAHVTLSLAGEATGTTSHTYKVVASNATGDSDDSDTDAGYRSVGAITYQWQRSAADSDAAYGNIAGGTTDPYNDTGAPANGDGRYFQCVLSSTGASNSPATSDNNRGYRITTPTVTTQAVTNIEDTTATGNGNITATGNGNCSAWGICWNLGGNPDTGDNVVAGSGAGGTGAFTASLTGLPTGTTIHTKAYATSAAGTSYGAEEDFLTKPAAPTNVAATDGVHTDKVVITWTKSTGATDYHVWRDAVDLGAAGDVATVDDSGADAATITAGTASASDGTVVAHVVLSLAGESTSNGTTHTYKVVASNATGDSDDSTTDTGYRGVGAITYAWQRSAGDSDDTFGAIGGGTTDPYNDTGTPANGDGRWFYCEVSATGAATQDSTHNRGYRGVLATVTVQAVSDINYFTAMGNGNITSIGTGNCDRRGFVWDLATQGDPGDVAPGASGYANSGADSGDYGTGAYTFEMDDLLDDTTYYVRAYVHSLAGYDYSDTEVSFTTVEAVGATVVTYDSEVLGTDATLKGAITDLGGFTVDYRGFVWNTTTHSPPGDVAPGASGYADNWTDSGSFDVEAFEHTATGLIELTTYFYRACAHNVEGWTYGIEITLFIGEEDKIYLELRPDLAETKIRGQAGVPSDFAVGEFNGYSLPIYDDDFEELNYVMCVPDRWDGESDILININCALAAGSEADNSYRWELLWEHFTPNEDFVPATSKTIYYQRYVYSNTQYESYRDWLVIDYDIDDGDPIHADDLIAITLRRVTVEPNETDTGEIVVFAVDILFARGDLLGDPDGVVMEVDMVLLAFIVLALGLTVVSYTFLYSNQAFSFAAVGGWLLLGIYGYTQSTATWDLYFGLFWVSMGIMLLMAVLAMRVWRQPKEEGETEEPSSIEKQIKKNEAMREKADKLNESMESSEARTRRKGRSSKQGSDSARLD